MKKVVTIIALSFLLQSVNAQIDNRAKIQYDDNQQIKSVLFLPQDDITDRPQTANDFFNVILKRKPTDSFIKNKRVKLRKGHETFNQYYKGVPVEGACYTFHYDKEGRMVFAHGKYVNIDDLETIPLLTKEDARDAYANYKKIDLRKIKGFSAKLVIKKNESIKTPTLLYRVFLHLHDGWNHELGYIDAQTGKVVYTETTTSKLGGNGWFETIYNNYQYARTVYNNGHYILFDNSKGAIIHTRDMKYVLPQDHSHANEVFDDDNFWYQNEQSNNKGMAFDVFWALQKIYDRLYDVHSINSFDNNGTPINAYTNERFYYYGMYIDNNSSWEPEDSTGYLRFGGQYTYGGPVSTLDVVAHEYGHGISYYQIGWSGNQDYLDEGLSDIWSSIMEYHYGSNNNSIWKIGEQLFPSYVTRDCIRNLQTPSSQLAEKQTAGTYLSPFYNSHSDVYSRGGVFSHWFYLLVNGDEGINDINHYYNVTGIGMSVAENLIVKAVFDNFLRGTENYEDVRESFIEAAEDMSIPGLVDTVCNAWYAVGVGGMNLSISGPDVICDEGVYSVDGLPSGFTVEWSLSDSNYDDYCLEMDTPNTNQCTITKDDYDSMIDATLTAYIKYNGTTVQTVTKEGISAYNDIIGHYTSGSISSDISYTHILPVTPGSSTIITSPVLKGATVSYSSSGTTPSYWAHISSSGEIVVIMPSNSNGIPIIFNIYDTCGNYYNLYLFASSSYSINVGDNSITVILNEYGESLRGLGDDLSWIVEIRNATTGELMTTRSTTSRSASISTAGWPKGMYIVRVTVGKESWSEKILIK